MVSIKAFIRLWNGDRRPLQLRSLRVTSARFRKSMLSGGEDKKNFPLCQDDCNNANCSFVYFDFAALKIPLYTEAIKVA
jgi:hypothetical protein